VLKATISDKPPIIEDEKVTNHKIKIGKNEYNRCKELFDMSNICVAFEKLELQYKMIDEVDVYNIIEYVLANVRED